MTLINWLLKPKCMLKHILDFCCMKIRYDFFFRLGRMHENKIFFLIFIFSTFQRKPGVLIPDLYLYGIKIQTNIVQN